MYGQWFNLWVGDEYKLFLFACTNCRCYWLFSFFGNRSLKFFLKSLRNLKKQGVMTSR